jgi:hypothetical protein
VAFIDRAFSPDVVTMRVERTQTFGINSLEVVIGKFFVVENFPVIV